MLLSLLNDQFLVTWTASTRSESSRHTGDPLGMRAWANRIAPRLVPGLSNGTRRVQGYGLLCAGLSLARIPVLAQAFDEAETWLRFERAWVFAQTAHATSTPGIPTWAGARRAGRLLGGGDLDLTIPLLGLQLQSGSWGLYRRSAARLGVIKARYARRGTSPPEVWLSSGGHQVARTWLDANLAAGMTDTNLAALLLAGRAHEHDVTRCFRADGVPAQSIGDALSNVALTAIPDGTGLRALRDVWDAETSLDLDALLRQEDLLDREQQAVLPEAVAVTGLVERVELPYREMIATRSDGAPSEAEWDHVDWDTAALRSSDMLGLREMGRSAPDSWAGVQQWAAELAARRGGRHTTSDNAPSDYDDAEVPACPSSPRSRCLPKAS